MKCKDCIHIGWREYDEYFYCEVTDSRLVDETAELKCPYAKAHKEIDSFKKGCLWCVYKKVLGLDLYYCSKLNMNINSVVLDGKDCSEFRIKNDDVEGM